MRKNNNIIVFLSVLLVAICTAPCLSAQNLDNLSIEELREMALKYRTIDNSKSFSIYLEAAKRGDPKSQYNVADFYTHGWGVAKDPTQAIYWFEKAVESGGCEEYCTLAGCYESTGNIDKAIKWYLVDISYDSYLAPTSACALGYIYKKRNNRSEAIKWFKKAADLTMKKYNRINNYAIEYLAELGVTYTPKKSTGTSVASSNQTSGSSSPRTSGSTASSSKSSTSSKSISPIKKFLATGKMWSIPYSQLSQYISQNREKVFYMYVFNGDAGIETLMTTQGGKVHILKTQSFTYELPSPTEIKMTYENGETDSSTIEVIDETHFELHFELGAIELEIVSDEWLDLVDENYKQQNNKTSLR